MQDEDPVGAPGQGIGWEEPRGCLPVLRGKEEAHSSDRGITPRVWCKNWESSPGPATNTGCWEQVESKARRKSHYNERERGSLQVDRTGMK